MKSKFSSMWRVGIALVLVLSMGLMAAPAAADVSSPRVTLDTAGPEAGAVYTINFIPTVDLAQTVDTITIVFPEDTDISGLVATTDADVDGTESSAVDIVGQRLTITLGSADVTAGTDIPVIVGTTNNVTNPLTGDHTLQVYTSQEPTAVTSQPYTIWTAASNALSLGTVVLDPVSAYAGATTAYTIPVQAGSESAYLPSGSTLTFQFPDGTGVSGVTGATFDGATASFAVSGQEVTVTLLAPKFLGSTSFKDVVISGVVNPDLAATGYILKVKSNVETTWVEETFNIVTGTTIVKLGFLVKPSVIAPDDEDAQVFTVQSQDQGGNLVVDISYVLLSSTSSTGTFWETAYATEITSPTGIQLDGGEISFYYKDATAGDYTITVTEQEPSTPAWTDATTPLTVSQQLDVALYHGASLVAYYHTITLAIADAVPGDTIKVGPGTYEEALLTLDVVDLTLESTGTAAETIIVALSGANAIYITASGVTVDGFTVQDTESGQTAINVAGTGDDATVKNNVMTTTEEDVYPEGIRIEASGATVSGNELDIHHTMMVISGSDITLLENTFGAGINLTTSDVDIIDNIIIGAEFTGIVFEGGAPFTDILIDGNTISGTPLTDELTEGIGISFRSNVDSVTNLTIQRNTITDNEGPGIVIPDINTFTDVVIKYNDISGNGDYGIENARSASVDAKYNYWGSATGPTITTNPGGTGDAVNTHVDYSPWRHKSRADFPTASYPALTVDLSTGWNTLSTPAKLISTADSVGVLVPTGLSIAYLFDDGWVQTTTDVLNPSDAVYILMLSDQTVLLQIDGGITWVPSKDLAVGWNLIGLASLTDMDDELAIASVFGSYAQLVSPSMNTAPWVYVTGQDVSGTANVLVGEGYWIFMKSEATLGGFTLCPIVPDLD